jgi:hypothetical protein
MISHPYHYPQSGLPLQTRAPAPRFNGFGLRCDTPMVEPHFSAQLKTYAYGEPTNQPTYADPITISSTSPVKTPTSESICDDLPEDTSKLKGILWPGMSLFDSATPTARRKRNQKKDASIVEQLEANSLDVEPTEMVWTPDGHLKKQKRISGMVDTSSSPFTASPPKRQRVALADFGLQQPYFGELGRHTAAWRDEAVEQNMMYSPFRRDRTTKRKRGFEVWQDEDAADRGLGRESTFARPTGFKYLTEGLGHGGAPHAGAEDTNSGNLRLFEDPFNRNSQVNSVATTPNYFSARDNSYSYAPGHCTQAYGLSSLADVASTSASNGNHYEAVASMAPPATINPNSYGYSYWPQHHGHYASVTHSRHSSLTVPNPQPERAMAPMYTSQADWNPGLNAARTATQPYTGYGHAHRTSHDYQAIFASHGFWGYNNATGQNDASVPRQDDTNPPDFFATVGHRKTDSLPSVDQSTTFQTTNNGQNGMQSPTEAAGLNIHYDAKIVPDHQDVSGQEPHAGAKTAMNPDYDPNATEDDSDATEDENRTISAPESQK